MKTKQMLLASIMGMLFPFFANAQQSVDPDLLGKFSPATINRLYGVVSKVDLPKEKQLLLAKLYQREDSLVTQALLKKSPQVMVDEIYVSTNRQQLKIFNEKELTQWKQYQNGLIKQPEAEQAYIKNKLAEIQKIRPLTPKEALAIEAGFLSICSKRNDSFDANLQEVLPGIISDTTIVGRVFKEVIAEKAKKATLKYPLEHDVPAILLNYSYNLIYTLNREQETLRIAYSTNPQLKDKKIEELQQRYQFKIDSVLMRNGYKLPKTQFANAIKFKEELKLKEEQLDSLVRGCQLVIQAKADYQKKNPGRYYKPTFLEKEKLPKILSSIQYDALLKMQANKDATKSAEDRWAAICKQGLNQGLDSVRVKQQLTGYFMNKLVANQRYADDKDRLKAELKNIEANAPAILRKLEAIRRNPTTASRVTATQLW